MKTRQLVFILILTVWLAGGVYNLGEDLKESNQNIISDILMDLITPIITIVGIYFVIDKVLSNREKKHAVKLV